MTTHKPYALTDPDVYYLNSINRGIGEVEVGKVGAIVTSEYLDHLRSVLPRLSNACAEVDEERQGPSLIGEVLADNRDWLDCFIDMVERGHL